MEFNIACDFGKLLGILIAKIRNEIKNINFLSHLEMKINLTNVFRNKF